MEPKLDPTKFRRVGNTLINLAQVTYITQRPFTENGRTDTVITVYFASGGSPLEFYASNPGGRMILDWWETMSELHYSGNIPIA